MCHQPPVTRSARTPVRGEGLDAVAVPPSAATSGFVRPALPVLTDDARTWTSAVRRRLVGEAGIGPADMTDRSVATTAERVAGWPPERVGDAP